MKMIISAADEDRREIGINPHAKRWAEAHDKDNDNVAADVIFRIQCRARMVARMRAVGMEVLDDEIF